MLKRKILVVDDDKDIREIIRFYLEDSGYEVIEAQNGKEALKLADELQPELITLDIIMPGLDGFEVLRLLKENTRTKDIPVIILSVVAEDHKYLHAFTDYLTKPFERINLISMVEKILLRLENKGKNQILIVDDEPDIVDIISTSLESEGYLTMKAFNGKEAVNKAEKEPPDLMILDLKMPLMDGYEVIKYFKSTTSLSHIPIIVLTGTHISEVDKQKGIQLGAEKYLTKPLTAKELVNQIKETLKCREKES